MKEITSDFTAQLKAEDEYAKSIDEILDAMATEVATDLKAPSK